MDVSYRGVTGNRSGQAGKRSLVSLFGSYLRSHGVVTKDVVVERSLASLSSQDEQVNELLESKAGGVLYVTLPSEVDPVRGGGQLAILNEVMDAMENKPVVCVLAGNRVGVRERSRFPLVPLQTMLVTPELQWQSRGKRRILQGGNGTRSG
jgi:hypothetical protein